MKINTRDIVAIFVIFMILAGYFIYREDRVLFDAIVFNVLPAILFILSGLAFQYQALKRLLYRPPELHDGVIYYNGKFSRFVSPDEIVFLLPFIEKAHTPISRHHRHVVSQMRSVFSWDGYPFDISVSTTYSLNLSTLLKGFPPDTISESLSKTKSQWETLVKDQVEIFIQKEISQATAEQIKKANWRLHFENGLLCFLRDTLNKHGVQFDDHHRPAIMNLVYFKSLQEAKNDKEVTAIKAKSNKEILEAIAHLLANDPNKGHQLLEACIAAGFVRGENSSFAVDSAIESLKGNKTVSNSTW